MYEIKKLPEDFVVEEIQDKTWSEEGKYLIYKLSKKGRNTEDVMRELTNQLKIKHSWAAYAGTKDKHALTTQYISIKGAAKEKINSLTLHNASCTFVGYHDEPLSLGSLKGNSFTILVRNIDPEMITKQRTLIPNYFGTQRFGLHNHKIGKALLQKNFKKACELVKESSGMPARLVDEELAKQEVNYVGALTKIPKKILRIYIHAYQSLLFNKMLQLLLEKNSLESLRDTSLPLLGFSSELSSQHEELLMKDNLTARDFIIRAIPELSSEGDMRKAIIALEDLHIGEKEPDELNQGMMKQEFRFSLPKGSYATVVLQELFSQSK